MTLELTEQQQHALGSEELRVRLVNPKTNTTYLLVPEEDYESIREVLEEQRQHKLIGEIGLHNAAGRIHACDGEDVTKKLNEVYSHEDSSLDPVIRRLQDVAIEPDDW